MARTVWTLEPGRVIARDGKSVLVVARFQNKSEGHEPALSPADADRLAHRIVALLNRAEGGRR